MTRFLAIRRSLVRPQLSGRNRGTASPCAHAPSLCRPRCSSTLSPSNLAALLRPSPPTSSSPSSPPDGETLTINGYVRTVRKQKRVAFAAIGDGSTLQTVQAVLAPQLAEGSVISLPAVPTGADMAHYQTLYGCCSDSHWQVDTLARTRPIP